MPVPEPPVPEPPGGDAPPTTLPASYAATKVAYEQMWARNGAAPTSATAETPARLAPATTSRHEFARLVGLDAWIKPECLKPVRRLGSGSFATGELFLRGVRRRDDAERTEANLPHPVSFDARKPCEESRPAPARTSSFRPPPLLLL